MKWSPSPAAGVVGGVAQAGDCLNGHLETSRCGLRAGLEVRDGNKGFGCSWRVLVLLCKDFSTFVRLDSDVSADRE